MTDNDDFLRKGWVNERGWVNEQCAINRTVDG